MELKTRCAEKSGEQRSIEWQKSKPVEPVEELSPRYTETDTLAFRQRSRSDSRDAQSRARPPPDRSSGRPRSFDIARSSTALDDQESFTSASNDLLPLTAYSGCPITAPMADLYPSLTQCAIVATAFKILLFPA